MEEDATGVWQPQTVRFCPRCTYPLTSIAYRGAEIDHCHRCGGTAVEPHAVEAHFGEFARPERWLESLGQATTGDVLTCPIDQGRMTGFQVPFDGRSVVVDHCDTCGCLWFDQGEGKKLSAIVGAASASRREKAALPSADSLAEAQDFVPKPGVATYVFQLFTGMPVEVLNPVHGRVIAVKLLLLAIALAFGAEVALLVTGGEPAVSAMARTWCVVPADLVRGQRLWALFTHMFLHAGVVHLLGNAYFLWVFGDNVEDRVGTGRFLALYFVAGLVGSLVQVATDITSDAPLLGASGAIAGLMGAYLMLFPRVKLWVVFFFIHWRVPVWIYFGFWVALQGLAVWLEATGVAWWAHLGGFFVGVVAGWLFRDVPHPLSAVERRLTT